MQKVVDEFILTTFQKVYPKHFEINTHWSRPSVPILNYFFTSPLAGLYESFSELSSYSEAFNLIEIWLSSQSHFVVFMVTFSYGCADWVQGHTVQTDSLWLSPCSYHQITVFWIMDKHQNKPCVISNGDAAEST